MAEYFIGESANPSLTDYPTLAEHGEQIDGGYTTLALLHNPFSTNARGTKEVIEQLKATADRHGLAVEIYETAPTAMENAANLQEIVTPNTVVGARTGDGPLGQILGATRAPVLVIPGGNKNDLAHQILSPQAYADPLYTLTYGRIRPIYPALLNFESTDNPATSLKLKAFGYGTVGPSSKTTAGINSDPYRAMLEQIRDVPGGKFIAERTVALHALMRSPAFSVQRDQEKSKRTLEFMVVNGSIMAGSLYPDVDLFSREARVIRARNRALGTLALAALSAGMPFGRQVMQDEQADYRITIPRKRHTMYVQVEGEEYKIAPGEYTLTVSIGNTAAQVLAA